MLQSSKKCSATLVEAHLYLRFGYLPLSRQHTIYCAPTLTPQQDAPLNGALPLFSPEGYFSLAHFLHDVGVQPMHW